MSHVMRDVKDLIDLPRGGVGGGRGKFVQRSVETQ